MSNLVTQMIADVVSVLQNKVNHIAWIGMS